MYHIPGPTEWDSPQPVVAKGGGGHEAQQEAHVQGNISFHKPKEGHVQGDISFHKPTRHTRFDARVAD